MAALNFSDVVGNFQQGSNWAQDFRANRQLEQARGLAIEGADYDMQARRASRKVRDPVSTGIYGALSPDDPSAIESEAGQLEDPFAFKMANWIAGKVGGARKRRAAPAAGGRAVDTGSEAAPAASNPVGPTTPEAVTYGDPDSMYYADGGRVRGSSQMLDDEDMKKRAAANRARTAVPPNETPTMEGADRTAKPRAIPTEPKPQGLARRIVNSGAGRLGAAGALGSAAIDSARTDTEDYRKRFGMETDDPSFLGDVGVRALGAASDVGNALTLGVAGRLFRDKQGAEEPVQIEDAPLFEEEPMPQGGGGGGGGYSASSSSSRRSAVPTSTAGREAPINLADIDVDPREIPDMKMGDWVQYRAQLMDAARRSGKPADVEAVDKQVTGMQIRGFTSYLQQGMSMQQAGNTKGAMAAYRAAYQYFPNGRDVEFGLHKGQIVGFGRDEKTGKPAEGGRPMLMDPERVAVMIENFSNPQAFRMWTKDWREFQQQLRKYEEVEKPAAQASADALATNADANVIRAQGLATGGAGGAGAGYKQSDMRGDAVYFGKATEDLALEKPQDARYLQAVMAQVKAQYPSQPPAVIAQKIREAYDNGSLPQKLKQMGMRAGAAALTPRQAVPSGEPPVDESNYGYNPYDDVPAQ